MGPILRTFLYGWSLGDDNIQVIDYCLAAIAFLFVCGIFLSCLIKVCVSKFATQVMVQQHVNEDSDVSEMFQFPNYWDDDIIKDHVVQEHCL